MTQNSELIVLYDWSTVSTALIFGFGFWDFDLICSWPSDLVVFDTFLSFIVVEILKSFYTTGKLLLQPNIGVTINQSNFWIEEKVKLLFSRL